MNSILTSRKGQEDIQRGHEQRKNHEACPRNLAQQKPRLQKGEKKKEEPGKLDWVQTPKDFQYQSSKMLSFTLQATGSKGV